jgi:pilus assembly protein Flp/PilA
MYLILVLHSLCLWAIAPATEGISHMTKFIINLRALLNGDRGASAVEYALLVGLIAIAVIAGVVLLGQNLGGTFNKVATTLPTP